jgi:phosphohistidine phosphatase
MTRQLLLLRHAKSSWDDMSIPDHDRPLSKRGRKAAAAMRAWIHAQRLAPDLALVSTALRTRQTFAALQPWPHPPAVVFMEALYHAPGPAMLELLRQVEAPVRTLLLVGHNPGLMELATLLAGEAATQAEGTPAQRLASAYPTAALAQFALERPWSRIGEGAERLTAFIIPRELKRAK